MLRIGTRGSALALWQASHVQQRLAEENIESTLVVIRTTGDMRADVPLSAIGGKGLFLKELEAALEQRTIDLAVHSLKDVPSLLDDQFTLAAYVERADPRDAWLSRTGAAFSDPSVTRVGSSSPRRKAQLLARRPELEVSMIRGNVDTRIEKMRRGEFDGIVLAAAGLQRLHRESEITSLFSVDDMTPAAGQGIVTVETLRDSEASSIVAAIDNATVRRLAEIERGVLQSFGTLLDCYSSIAVHAFQSQDSLTAYAFVSDLDGSRVIRESSTGRTSDGEAVVSELADKLKTAGAVALLAQSTEASGA